MVFARVWHPADVQFLKSTGSSQSHQKMSRWPGTCLDLTRRSPDSGMINVAGQRIMVVDDDPGIRRSLDTLFSRAGYQVIQAADGSEAVRLWRDHGADLVITDLHMPKKDGIQTIVELLSYSPGIPIIAMSGGGQTKRLDLLGNLTLLGRILTIEKPFTLDEMMLVVGEALRRAS
jgi:DNA-binding response OmpR family regulator